MKMDVRVRLLFWCTAFAGAFFCTPVETDQSDEGPTILRLSLEEIGRKTAEFSGAPIEAIIELDRDTSFGVLYWHTGQGDPPRCADTVFTKTAKRFSVLLFWTKYPLVRDSVDSCYYDTVWVSMGGSMKKSNKVQVKVTNLPVVIDSARFDSTLFLGQDTVWQCSIPAKLKPSYPFNVYARDLDRKPVSLQIIGNKGKIVRDGLTSLSMEYQAPQGDFIDTLYLFASDQLRGQSIRTLILNHITPNIPPFIDSIQVETTLLKGSSMAGGTYRVGFPAFDTLRLRLFAHDSSGTIKKVAWRALSNELTVDSVNNMLAVYVCLAPECGDTLKDSSVIVDTITVKVVDDRGDSTLRKIQLSKGTINQPPQVRSIRFGATTIVFSDTMATVNALGGVAHWLKLDAADPERKPLTVTWAAYPSSRLAEKTDSSARYTAPAQHDTDTVRVTVSDGVLSINRMIRIVTADIIPVFDSIVSNDTVFKGTDSTFSTIVMPRDTLLFIAHAVDRDSTDSMTYIWTAGKPERFGLRVGNRARYILPDSSLNDTIILTLDDGAVQVVRKIALIPVNRVPIVDSILGDGKRLPVSGAVYRDTAIAADTVTYLVFARDPEGSGISFGWSTVDTTRLSSLTGQSIKYISKDSVYIDTVALTVRDKNGASVNKKILLQVDSLVTP